MIEYNQNLNDIIREICINNPKNFPQVLKSKKNKDIWDYVLSCTKTLQEAEIKYGWKYTVATYVNWVLNGISEFPLCLNEKCRKPIIRPTFVKWFNPYPRFCDNNNFCMNQSEYHKTHVADTLEEHYGVRVPAKSPIIQKRMEYTYFKETGYIKPSFNPEVVEKITQKSIENAPSTLEKIKAWNNTNYGVDWFVQTEEFKQKSGTRSGVSKEEKQLIEELKKITNEELVIGSFKVIYPRQLDVYIPSLKIGIEFNGMYFHSLEFGDSGMFYHINKTKKCEEMGIKLIHIWEDEWWNDKNKVMEQIRSIIEGKSYMRMKM